MFRVAFVGAILLLCTLGIAFLAFDVSRKIAAQATASSDNVQWSLSQIDVEMLSLHTALATARQGSGSLEQVRSRFDVFYSRATTFRTSEVFSILHENADYLVALDEIWKFLDRSAPIIDSPNDVLQARLKEIEDDVADLHKFTRQIALIGIKVFAERKDAERRDVTTTLSEVALLTLVLIAVLVGLVWVLMRVDRQNQSRARENLMTLARMEAVVTSALDAVIVVDALGTVLEFNTAAEMISGFRRDEALGENLTNLIVPDHMAAAHSRGMATYRNTSRTSVVGKGRLRMEAKRRDGTVFPIEMSVSRAWSDVGEIFVAFLRDVTQVVAAEQELLRARDAALAAAKAKSDLLAVMSHEMRTPLNGMLGTIELLGETDLSPRQRGLLRVMETSGRMLLHHVNDVLDISRLDSGKMPMYLESVDLGQLVTEVLDSQRAAAQAHGNQLQPVLPDPALPEMISDPIQLRQVLLNLVGNAIKFTKNGRITLGLLPPDANGMTEFRISDTGIGIESDKLDHIFDDFVTLDASYKRVSGGTGLGLGITRRLVQGMGGSILVESTPGLGTTFRVLLPMALAVSEKLPAALPHAESGVAGDTPSAPPAPKVTPLRVLLVEDNPVNRLVAREMLQAQGHHVAEAHDGEEGVRTAGAQHFDVILMDISMPRMDGLEATRAIRSGYGLSQQVPIVALTAHALESEVATFLAAGMQLVLNKPISGKALAKALADALETAPPPPLQHAAIQEVAKVIDTDNLAEFFETLGSERGLAMLTKYLTATDAQLPDLVAAIQSGSQSLTDSQQQVHKLAGSSAIFGAKALGAALRDMETACKEGNAEAVAETAQDLPALWQQTRSALLAAHPTTH